MSLLSGPCHLKVMDGRCPTPVTASDPGLSGLGAGAHGAPGLPARHGYGFDPTHGYSFDELVSVGLPEAPDDFERFWSERYRRALDVSPRPRVQDLGWDVGALRVFDLSYFSTDAVRINGWVVVPADGAVERACVVGHGYGGRSGPDFHLPVDRCAFVFPCFRGLGRSPHPPISSEPWWHVLHDIDKRDRYVIGGCVEDLWLAVSATLRLFPQVQGRIGYLGISFGGGVGALGVPFDPRVRRAHYALPTFGHHPLRLGLPAVGSVAAVQAFERAHPGVALRTLRYYDAAVASRHAQIPVHCALALFDPHVPAPGQFAIYNGLPGPKSLFVHAAGHHAHPREADEQRRLLAELRTFFEPL